MVSLQHPRDHGGIYTSSTRVVSSVDLENGGINVTTSIARVVNDHCNGIWPTHLIHRCFVDHCPDGNNDRRVPSAIPALELGLGDWHGIVFPLVHAFTWYFDVPRHEHVPVGHERLDPRAVARVAHGQSTARYRRGRKALPCCRIFIHRKLYITVSSLLDRVNANDKNEK